MKELKILLALFVSTLVSCSHDDNTIVAPVSSGAGTLIINDMPQPVNNAYIVMPYTGTNPDYDKRRFYLILTDGTVAASGNNLIYGNDIHNFIDFNLYTYSDTPGVFQNTFFDFLVPVSSDQTAAFIDHATVGSNVIFQNNEPALGDVYDSDDMESGHARIDFINGVYSVHFYLANIGTNISGTYTGRLTMLPYQY